MPPRRSRHSNRSGHAEPEPQEDQADECIDPQLLQYPEDFQEEYYDYTAEGDAAQQMGGGSSSRARYHCTLCDKSYEKNSELTRHMRRHDKPIPCIHNDTCGYRTAQQKDMNRHYWTTHREWARENNVPNTRVECDYCGETLERDDNLKKHMERKHPDKEHKSKRDRKK
ncbi:Zinc finger protein [Paramyrothecium foliicola]|nr:Zinc finger protein [Paramyrothecium foliicola]